MKYLKSREGKVYAFINKAGQKFSSYGIPNSSGQSPTRMQKIASSVGTRMMSVGQKGLTKVNNSTQMNVEDTFINVGVNSLNNAARKVMPRASYNNSCYERRKNMLVVLGLWRIILYNLSRKIN